MSKLRFLRYGKLGSEKPGLVDFEGKIRSLVHLIDDIDVEKLALLEETLGDVDIGSLPVVPEPVRIGAPIAKVGNIIAVGLNYHEHIEETAARTPEEPLLFNKAPSAICGPNDPIIIPKNANNVDWEVELVIVIGKESRYLTKENALQAIAGYCLGIDVSERSFQKDRGGQWLKGKSADSFAPVGPYLIPTSQVDLSRGLSLWLDVNGNRKQQASTLQMIHDVPTLVSYISQFMSLHPGDLIFTGTPDGVGFVRNPPEFLHVDDTVSCGISGLGEQTHTVIQYIETFT